MRILFWNTHRNADINIYLYNLVQDYNIDILVTSEYTANEKELGTLFENSQQNLIKCNTEGCDRINVWSNYVDVKSGLQEDYYSIQIIKQEYILCCVHLMSDLHSDHSRERFSTIQQIMYEIREAEKSIHSNKTIIIGDINEMPYGEGCLCANAFHGLPALNFTDRSTRQVTKKKYRKFYNPMWNFMGDFSYPPGTYYLNKSDLYCPMWYMLDQVIVSQDILPQFRKEELKIITTCSYTDLMDRNGHPNKKISDHFPIMCEIASV